jgi:hypothetical protein
VSGYGGQARREIVTRCDYLHIKSAESHVPRSMAWRLVQVIWTERGKPGGIYGCHLIPGHKFEYSSIATSIFPTNLLAIRDHCTTFQTRMSMVVSVSQAK